MHAIRHGSALPLGLDDLEELEDLRAGRAAMSKRPKRRRWFSTVNSARFTTASSRRLTRSPGLGTTTGATTGLPSGPAGPGFFGETRN